MGLFDEIDIKASRVAARNILQRVIMLSRIADVKLATLKSPLISNMPKSVTQTNSLESRIINQLGRGVEAQSELKQIIDAVYKLDIEERVIIYYSYFETNKKKDFEIAELIYHNLCSLRTMQNKRDKALLEFCEYYKHGELLVFRSQNHIVTG